MLEAVERQGGRLDPPREDVVAAAGPGLGTGLLSVHRPGDAIDL